MTKLHSTCKVNNDLQQEINSLREILDTPNHKCLALNNSLKETSLECCELKNNLEAETGELNSQLAQCKVENLRLQTALDRDADAENARILSEIQKQMNVLTTERKRLLTTVEVLEAKIKCLRAELRSVETKARRRRSSFHDLPSTLNGSFSSQPTLPLKSQPQPTKLAPQPITSASNLPLPPQHADERWLLTNNEKDFSKVLVIGDSHLRHSSTKCSMRGAFIECIPGGKILDIKNVLLSYVGVGLAVVYIHVGCNNLKRGYNGGPGYNGGHGKRKALHDMAELLFTAKTKFPETQVVLNSVLTRHDIGYRALYGFNSQLELMCNNFGVDFVEANTCVSKKDLTQDGVHFNRRSISRLGTLLVDNVTKMLQTSHTNASVVEVSRKVNSSPLPSISSSSSGNESSTLLPSHD